MSLTRFEEVRDEEVGCSLKKATEVHFWVHGYRLWHDNPGAEAVIESTTLCKIGIAEDSFKIE